MASAWGSSWGSAWASSWGTITARIEVGGGNGLPARKKRLYEDPLEYIELDRLREDEEEAMLAVLTLIMTGAIA